MSSISPEPDAKASGDAQAIAEKQSDKLPAAKRMHDRYGRLLRWAFERFFGPISYPRKTVEALRELNESGTLIYVAQAPSQFLVLYFNYALQRFGMPLAQYIAGVDLGLWRPLGSLFSDPKTPIDVPHELSQRFNRKLHRDEAAISACIQADRPSLVVLPTRHLRLSYDADLFRAVVATQRLQAKPVYLVPHLLAHRSTPPPDKAEARRRGKTRLQPISVLLSPQHASVRVGEVLNVKEYCERFPDLDDEAMSKKLQGEIERRIKEEFRVISGAPVPSNPVLSRHIWNHPRVQKVADELIATGGQSRAALKNKAERQLKEIAAKYRVGYIKFLDSILHGVFNRIYEGIVVDRPGLERTLEYASKAPLVFLPSHKSHVDYLVLSYTLWHRGVTPPYIAAGSNLSFFPIGPMFRGAGAFFLRRSFRGAPMYRAVFQTYLEELVRAGTPIEFFLEGGRSRTGKLLPPKFGLLSMLIDAFRTGVRDDLYLVPTSIDYERVVESQSYQNELSGGSKKPEDIGALLKTTKVLRSRYGRVHVQFAEPLSLKALLEQYLGDSDDPQELRAAVQKIAYRVMHDIGMVASVTPTSVAATALLGHENRGLSQKDLLSVGKDIVNFLDTEAARLSASLSHDKSRDAAIIEAVEGLVKDEMVLEHRAGRNDDEAIYQVIEDKRVALDFHKNAVMNQFAAAAIVSRALTIRGDTAPYSTVQDDARFLSRLFKHEFVYRVDSSFSTHFDDTLGALAIRGFIDVQDDALIQVKQSSAIRLLSGLLQNFIETYWATFVTLRELQEFPLWEAEIASRAFERCRRLYLEGRLLRPEAANQTVIKQAILWAAGRELLLVEVQDKKRSYRLNPAREEELGGILIHMEHFIAIPKEPVSDSYRLAQTLDDTRPY